MNKIWTLYNMEFKRIYKLYFILLGVMGIGNIFAIGNGLYQVEQMIDSSHLGFNIDLLRSNRGVKLINENTTVDIYLYGSIILGVAVLICLMYALGIWYRDYFSRNKTIYTLLSLPQSKFNIYISKFMMIVGMIYGVIAFQFLMWFIDLNIIKLIAGINTPSFTNIFTNMMQRVQELNIVSPYAMDFLIINIIAVIVSVMVLFNGVLIERSFKKIGAIVGVIYIGLYIFGFILTTFLAVTNYSTPLLYHILYFISTSVVSIIISYSLLNKRIQV